MAYTNCIALKSLKKTTLLALTLMILTVASGTVFAAAAPQTPCDPEFMDALEARAWMEAQREISQNQNLIVKPDSVLEYSCFDKILDALGGNASFSDGGAVPAGTLANNLTSLVGQAAGSYVKDNFGHTWLGGRAGGNSTLDAGPYTVQQGSYSCNNMATVWQLAKCMNIFDKPAQDGFFDFAWYTNDDPRKLPTTPAPLAACPAPAPLFNTRPQIAFNGVQAKYMLNPENPNNAAPYNQDPVVSYYNLIDPGNCGDPIPTGVKIERPGFNPNQYEDHVCPNPGCYYDPNANDCVNN